MVRGTTSFILDPKLSFHQGEFASDIPTSIYSAPRSDLHRFATRNADLARQDDLDTNVMGSTSHRTPIYRLFNFEKRHWLDRIRLSGQRGYDQELAVYELLDLDAEGEEDEADDGGIEVDGFTQEVLL